MTGGISGVGDRRAVRLQATMLAPSMWRFDNIDAVQELLEYARVPGEEWTVDLWTGVLHIPGVGSVRAGQYIVSDGRTLEVRDSLERWGQTQHKEV